MKWESKYERTTSECAALFTLNESVYGSSIFSP